MSPTYCPLTSTCVKCHQCVRETHSGFVFSFECLPCEASVSSRDKSHPPELCGNESLQVVLHVHKQGLAEVHGETFVLPLPPHCRGFTEWCRPGTATLLCPPQHLLSLSQPHTAWLVEDCLLSLVSCCYRWLGSGPGAVRFLTSLFYGIKRRTQKVKNPDTLLKAQQCRDRKIYPVNSGSGSHD